ncbi:sugar phosphate isomerase/epimerase [Chitinophaga niastensis]|uniref:Sugar phosphate isomerase/epimerase n=1 Tax=Chitinophaga niastensis TaxID=536980 RepID=A0A2P8HNX4_CHINA|nr:sugar phosphate isomerase/epimerase family protein [Chitinophaga niastensis]PSL47919.1 sugar phosphate isomerase/epimerase [Chitinophaga niastensis]
MKTQLVLVFSLLIGSFLQSNAQSREPVLPVIGIATSFENDSLAAASGFTCLEETVKKILSPAVSDLQFNAQLQIIRHARCKIQTCNVFIPGYIKIAGKEVNEARVLGYVDSVMQRAKIAGIRLIVLGSGEARKISADADKAVVVKQFVLLARKMATIAARYDCIIAMENLNSSETNFVNTLAEGNEIVTAVNHPNFRLTADIYHMLKENESPASIEKAKGNLVHCHIAERETRTAPGVTGQDFRPYFAALRKIGFHGRIMMECRWDDPAKQYKQAFDYLQGQLNEAYQATNNK